MRDTSRSDGRCVVCDHSLTDDRCEHCGAAARAGRFLILRQIAQTPRGRMYLAEDESGARVALKELVFSTLPSVEQLESFRREARLLRELSHPSIPRFVDAFEAGSGVGTRLYIAQEFVDGSSLADALERHRFDEREARAILGEVLEILVWLQDRRPPVFHRDIKPANLIRRANGRIALVDFGSARDTVLGTMGATVDVGTWGYAPPEQLGGEVDATSDLHALGATVVHLLARQPPRELLTRQGLGHLGVSDFLQWFLGKLCAPDAADRFADASQALRALREGRSPSTSARTNWPARRLLVLAVTTALAIASMSGGIVASYYVLQPRPSSVRTAPHAEGFRPLVRKPWHTTELGRDPNLEKMAFRDLAVAGATSTEELRALADADARSTTAIENLKAIRAAEEAHREKRGRYLEFDEATDEVLRTLGVTLPAPVHHRYSVSVADGKLAMMAVGNVDADPFQDRYSISRVGTSEGMVVQTAIDTLNFDYTTLSVQGRAGDGTTPFVLELAAAQERSLEAARMLESLYRAQQIWKQGTGAYLEFDELTPEIVAKLGVTLPSPSYHRYSARLEDGELLLRAEGNVDGDSAEDVWTLKEGGKPRQPEMDWVNLGREGL